MSLTMASFNNSSTEDPLLKTENYQPNFILLGEKKNIFGDIIPVYKSNQELSDIIISSQESLIKMIFISKIFFICLFSFVLESINNVAYQSLLFVSAIKNQVNALPDYYNSVKKSFVELTNILTNHDTRDLWWLDFKLELKQSLNTIKTFLNSFTTVISKFYLSSLVIAILWVVSTTSLSSNSNNVFQGSVLSKALENHTTASTITPSTQNSVPILSLLRQESEAKDLLLSNQVITHKVTEGETVDIIAESYGLSPETVIFNNQLDESKPLPETLYLPWTEGYLYQTKADTSLEDLERIYGVDKNLIYSENEDLLDREKDVFPAKTFVLIPTTNYTKVAASNSTEDVRKQNLEKSSIQRNTVRRPTANLTSKVPTTFSTSARSSGFIWPTQGNISRCVTGAHVACDIANPSLPTIFAAQKGTVYKVDFQPGGYGNVVMVDHGNGLQTIYAHLSRVDVRVGQQLIQGESMGKMGCTGRCTGPHLHFEVHLNGVKQNPLAYLP